MFFNAPLEMYNQMLIFGYPLLGIGLIIGVAVAMGIKDTDDFLLMVAMSGMAGILAGFHTPIWIPVILTIFVMIRKVSE